MKPSKTFSLIGLIIIILMTNTIQVEWNLQAIADELPSDGATTSLNPNDSWIVKWKNDPDPSFVEYSEIIEELPLFNAVVARPLDKEHAIGWAERWNQSQAVQYIQPNHKVEIATKPNDRLYASQTYLQQIRAEAAWDVVTENRSITIAVVDTGVDLTHVDLRSNLVRGVNLIDRSKQPQDDNGHGTNVAGIIGAVGNNEQGIAGIVWRTRIMPIKALEANGSGDESKLGEGIRYAVDNGAKIVVLSLGLYKYSPFMQEVVQHAEDNGVLLVAATGNDGQAVKYPAAYPTVLAVGGVNQNNTITNKSNFGPELDIVAPWQVYTTAKDGGYVTNEGTSMAAPQAAGAAALILAKYPNMKPYQIRNLLRQTAQDIGPNGWDEQSGYGMLRLDRALTEGYQANLYRDNNTRRLAKPMPLNSMFSASLNGGTDQDWFSIQAPYNGSITFQFSAETTNRLSQMELVYYAGNSSQGTTYQNLLEPITVSINNGTSYIQIRYIEPRNSNVIHYSVIPEFTIYTDDFEDNDRQFKAFQLPVRDQIITGTFHQLNDEDWFMINVEQSGSLRVKTSTDTYRMDLEMLIQKQGERPMVIDLGLDGETEYSPAIDVFPGKYYIRIRNVISETTYPVMGEYSLEINYMRKYIDPNEPNNRAFQATVMNHGTQYQGVLTDQDVDWYSFRVDSQKLIKIQLTDIPTDRLISMTLMDHNQQQLVREINNLGERTKQIEMVLPSGNYYVRLTSNQGFEYQMYGLKVTEEQLVSGYRDIANHWARTDIVHLTERGILQGYADYRFNPNKEITRAEAAVMIVKALNLTNHRIPEFIDLNSNHWAYSEIAIAAHHGIINGYPNGTFAPNRAANRVEMTVMIANALGMSGTVREINPFTDISDQFWAAQIIHEMHEAGWINGYDDGTFKPDRVATRAEFTSILSRMIR